MWIGGGLIGALVGHLAGERRLRDTALSAAMSAVIVGAVGDKVLENA